MCEYCKEEDTGDYVTKEIIDECRPGLFEDVIFQLSVDYGKIRMYVDRSGGSDNFFEAEKEIHYCPMCGRKLGE